jgi:hypothetical protein
MGFGDTIIAKLGLDIAGFQSGLKSSEGFLAGFAKRAAGLLGISVGLSGLESSVNKLVEYGAHVQDLSERYGVNAEALQRLGNAAELNGSSLEGVAKGFNKLEIAQSRALAGSDKQIQAFTDLGVSVDDLKKLSPEEIMLKLGKSSLNAADAVTILGKSALELRPTLIGVANGTVQLGRAVDAIDIKKLKEAKDYFEKLGQGFTVNAASGLIGLSSIFRSDTWKEAAREQESSAKSFFGALKAIVHGNLSEASTELQNFKRAAVDVFSTLSSGKPASQGDKPAGKPSKGPADLLAERLATIDKGDRLNFSLKELAARPSVFSNEQSIQEWWAGDQARKVMSLESEGRRQSAAGDRFGGALNIDRADQVRSSVNSLNSNERGGGGNIEPILQRSELHLQNIAAEFQKDE